MATFWTWTGGQPTTNTRGPVDSLGRPSRQPTISCSLSPETCFASGWPIRRISKSASPSNPRIYVRHQVRVSPKFQPAQGLETAGARPDPTHLRGNSSRQPGFALPSTLHPSLPRRRRPTARRTGPLPLTSPSIIRVESASFSRRNGTWKHPARLNRHNGSHSTPEP